MKIFSCVTCAEENVYVLGETWVGGWVGKGGEAMVRGCRPGYTHFSTVLVVLVRSPRSPMFALALTMVPRNFFIPISPLFARYANEHLVHLTRGVILQYDESINAFTCAIASFRRLNSNE